jgi:hypothetical protein
MMGTFRLPPIFMSTCKLERYMLLMGIEVPFRLEGIIKPSLRPSY